MALLPWPARVGNSIGKVVDVPVIEHVEIPEAHITDQLDITGQLGVAGQSDSIG